MSAHTELEHVAELRGDAATPDLQVVPRLRPGVHRPIAAALLGGIFVAYALVGVLIYVVVAAVV